MAARFSVRPKSGLEPDPIQESWRNNGNAVTMSTKRGNGALSYDTHLRSRFGNNVADERKSGNSDAVSSYDKSDLGSFHNKSGNSCHFGNTSIYISAERSVEKCGNGVLPKSYGDKYGNGALSKSSGNTCGNGALPKSYADTYSKGALSKKSGNTGNVALRKTYEDKCGNGALSKNSGNTSGSSVLAMSFGDKSNNSVNSAKGYGDKSGNGVVAKSFGDKYGNGVNSAKSYGDKYGNDVVAKRFGDKYGNGVNSAKSSGDKICGNGVRVKFNAGDENSPQVRVAIASPEDDDDDDEDDDDDDIYEKAKNFSEKRTWLQTATPSRSQWEYRQGGILIQEVIEGQACLNCEDSCPGFTQHPWRKTCNSCKCPKEAHDVYHEEWVNVRERLGFQPVSDPRTARDKVTEGFSWVPPGLPSSKVEQYFRQVAPGKVPRVGTAGDKYRDRQLMWQLPKQDLALAYCKHVESQHHSSYEDFINARNEIALDIAYITDNNTYNTECPTCHEGIGAGEMGVTAPKFGERTLWHPSCFVCSSCDELLVDLTYCVHDDLLYCERHYAEQLKPRCAACDELIFSGEYTKAMSKDWHSGHFCCWQCDESLTGQRYVLRDDHPYCIKCYESVFANMCEECSKTIGIDSKDLSYKDKHWHEACFLCNKCRVSLVDKQFGSKADKIYCSNCYDAQFASRCDGCGEIFRAGTKKMEYKTRQWHEKCFCCCVCKSAIGTKSFIPREQEIYCATCYEEKFATRCVKCNKIITSGGVTYKNEPWHRECFTCTHCNTSLAGQRFTSRDEKPYCAECFGELFAKRCTACVKPITGIGGTRFISFEDRHWHNDCFICASCKTSLVGRGFITDAEDIICPECAKQKLM